MYQTRTHAIRAENEALDDIARISRALDIVAKFQHVLGAYPNAGRALNELAAILRDMKQQAQARRAAASEQI